jgi:hypothetical protein
LNEIVRQVVREKLKELEEPIVRITIDSFRKILQEEKDIPDPFDCLKDNEKDSNIFNIDGADYSFMNSVMFNRDSGPNTMTMAPLYTKVNTGSCEKDSGDAVKVMFIDDDYTINSNKPDMSSMSLQDGVGKWMTTDSDDDADEDELDEDEDDVQVVTKDIHGKKVYIIFEEDVNKTFGGHAVYRRDVKDDETSEVGDIIGFLDDHDEYWEVVQNGGKIVGFEKDNLFVPTLKGTTYPEWVKMEPKEE